MSLSNIENDINLQNAKGETTNQLFYLNMAMMQCNKRIKKYQMK